MHWTEARLDVPLDVPSKRIRSTYSDASRTAFFLKGNVGQGTGKWKEPPQKKNRKTMEAQLDCLKSTVERPGDDVSTGTENSGHSDNH